MLSLFIKKLTTLLLLILTVVTYGQASDTTNKVSHKKKLFGYASVYTGYGALFTHRTPINLSVGFPYTSSVQGNNAQNFATYKSNIYPKILRDFETLHIDYAIQNYFIDFCGGWFGGKTKSNPGFRGGFLLCWGAGAYFPFDFKKGLPKKEKRFAVQASINWSVNDFSVDIGSISNAGTTINALGITAAPSYTYVAYHGKQSYIANGTATNLSFQLGEEYQFIYPKISIITNPLKGKLHCGISMAYNIPIKHTETLDFSQSDGNDNSGGGGSVNSNNKNLTLISNGNRVNYVPFKLNGVCLTLSVGLNIDWFNTQKRK